MGWTVASAVRRSDLVALYGHGSNKTFGFIGIVLTDPVESLADGHWWSWIEFVRTAPVSLSRAKCDPNIREWPSFRNMSWTARSIDDEYWLPLVDLMLRDAVDAQQQMREWPQTYVDEPDLPSLRYEWRRFPNADGSGKDPELTLQKWIRQAWIGERRGREIDLARDRISIPSSLKLGSAGFADIILVDVASDRTLHVIEVKRAAKPGVKTDGVTQLSGAYVPWLKRTFPDWDIKPILIALNISDAVVGQAKQLGIECWEFDPEEHEFRGR